MTQSINSVTSVPALLQTRAQSNETAQRVKRFGLWQSISWQEHTNSVNALAAKLFELGVKKGDKIGLLSENRPEWLVSDLAIQTTGAISVGIYSTSSPKQLHYVLEHSQSSGLILENAEQLEKWFEIEEQLPKIKWVIVIEPEGFKGLLSYEDAIKQGKELFKKNPKQVEDSIKSIQNEDICLLMYTSGTTGYPKAVMLSHKNMLWAASVLQETLGYNKNDEIISYLPLSHIVERGGSYAAIRAGFTTSFVENLDTFAQNLQEIRPTVLFAVPRIWEKMHSLVELHMRENHFLKRAMYNWATKNMTEHATAGLLANITVIKWLKYRLGLDRLRIAISGAAPISPQILAYFRFLGIDLREGYGMTENSGLTSIHQDSFKYGTVGTAFPGVNIKIAEDGEILSKSDGTMMGYYRDQEATDEVIIDGWLHSGDIGEFDEDGHLKITDRKKDIIITAGGKNIAPQKIENLLKSSIFINDAVVIGDKRKYLVALLVLDEDNITQWAAEQQLSYTTYSDLAGNEDVYRLIEKDVEAANKQLARVETIKKFAILPKRLYYEDGEVTATLKVKRSSISKKYQDLIESLY